MRMSRSGRLREGLLNMDQSQVAAWMDDNLSPLLDAFGLSHWAVDYTFKRLGGNAAEIFTQNVYECATIYVDPFYLVSEEELQKEIIHEIAHIVASPFDAAEDAVYRLNLDDNAHRVLKEVMKNCAERTAKNIERMHYQHVELLTEADEEGEGDEE